MADAPVPVVEGSFAIFTPPSGELLVVWRKRGEQDDRYLPVPAWLVTMAARKAGFEGDDVASAIRERLVS